MTIKAFRIFLASACVVLVLAVIATFATRQFLPDELRAYLSTRHHEAVTRIGIFRFIILLSIMLVSVVSIVGMFMLKKWARVLATGITVVSVVISISSFYPIIRSSMADTLMSVTSLLNGIILCAMWFAQGVRNEFDK